MSVEVSSARTSTCRLAEKSPYRSTYHLKVLHDYFDIDCQAVGYSKEGVPILKMKRINKNKSLKRFDERFLNSTGERTPFVVP